MLGKPIRPQLLLRQLAACKGYGLGGAAAVSEPSLPVSEDVTITSDGARPIRILLAEDNIVNQKVALAMLLRMGHEVTIANNGREAFEQVQEEEFDVVLMDIHMPEMDGFEALRNIRDLKSEVSSIPIVALTANAMKGDREKYLVAGMDEYIPKPIDTELLAKTLSKVTGIEGRAIAKPSADNKHNDEDLAREAADVLKNLDDLLEG